MSTTKSNAPAWMVILAFATIYLVWGSTYFFIQIAVQHIPALILGAIRFLASGLIMLLYCLYRKETVILPTQMKYAAITGILMLFIGTGAVIWAETSLPSSLVAVLVASQSIWFVVLDKPHWKENFRNAKTLLGIAIGFIGVILLFSETAGKALHSSGTSASIIALIILIIGTIGWAGGSLYSKHKLSGSFTVTAAWQMLAAGFAFLISSFFNHEWSGLDWTSIPIKSWLAVLYLVTMGSLAGFSAFVWLLQVRPATQVSTHGYVNPVVAVLLGVFFAGEQMTRLQFVGLGVILLSVVLINIAKYKKSGDSKKAAPIPSIKPEIKAVAKPGKTLVKG